MKLNISNPLNNVQKSIEIDDEKKLLPFMERRIGNIVSGDSIGEEFTGYVFKITGGNDKQGFPMMQGVLTNNRVRLLFKKGMKCYRPRKNGEKKRKSVRGCIVGQDLSALNLALVKKGANGIPGLTDKTVGKKLGPKRASKIRKLFNLDKSDDVRKYVIGRSVTKNGKTRIIKPKIQRLVTEKRLFRKKTLIEAKKKQKLEKKKAIKEYKQVLKKYSAASKKEDHEKKSKVKKDISKKRVIKKKENKVIKNKAKKENKPKDNVKATNVEKTIDKKEKKTENKQKIEKHTKTEKKITPKNQKEANKGDKKKKNK